MHREREILIPQMGNVNYFDTDSEWELQHEGSRVKVYDLRSKP